jgi:hypothetical protein
MITLYDKDGKQTLVWHAVDAKEMIATGEYFRENPLDAVQNIDTKGDDQIIDAPNTTRRARSQ